ncbi:protein of unknown function [Enterobacter cancerogenus]|nr:protein of unknown function [Enterobacter cancerogenus]
MFSPSPCGRGLQTAEVVFFRVAASPYPTYKTTALVLVFSLSLWERAGVRASDRRGRIFVGWRLRLTRPTKQLHWCWFSPSPWGRGAG